MSDPLPEITTSSVRAVQLALFDEDFNLGPELRTFAHVYLENGYDATAAVLAVRPHLGRDSAVTLANRWLGTRQPTKGSGKGKGKSEGNAELLRYISWMQARATLRAELTEAELIEKSRRVFLHAVGDLAVPKTIFQRDRLPYDAWVREPNLSAANQSIENLRKLGGFGQDDGATVTVNASLATLTELDENERAVLGELVKRRAQRIAPDTQDAD